MCTAPPLAIDRLAGLAGVNRRLAQEMGHNRLPAQLREHELNKQLQKLCDTSSQLLDIDLFPWLKEGQNVEVTPDDRTRAATIIADRLCNTLANPIIRNEQERRQLRLIATFLEQHGYTKQSVASTVPISTMRAGTYAIRLNITAGKERPINIPIDVVIQPKNTLPQQIPIFIEQSQPVTSLTQTSAGKKKLTRCNTYEQLLVTISGTYYFCADILEAII